VAIACGSPCLPASAGVEVEAVEASEVKAAGMDRELVETAAPGCPAERGSAGFVGVVIAVGCATSP